MDSSLHHDPATLWAPRRQLTLAQARRRTDRVRYLRYALVALAAVAIGLFVGYIFRSALSQDARAPAVDAATAEQSTVMAAAAATRLCPKARISESITTSSRSRECFR